jgi:hypothetical protein
MNLKFNVWLKILSKQLETMWLQRNHSNISGNEEIINYEIFFKSGCLKIIQASKSHWKRRKNRNWICFDLLSK